MRRQFTVLVSIVLSLMILVSCMWRGPQREADWKTDVTANGGIPSVPSDRSNSAAMVFDGDGVKADLSGVSAVGR